MPQKKPAPKRPGSGTGLRPGQDFVIPKAAAKFPTVGMTLNTYQKQKSGPGPMPKGSMSSTAALSAGRPAFSPKFRQPGRLRRILSLKHVVVTIAIVGLAIGSWVGFKFVYNAHKLFGGSILGLITTSKLKGEDQGRVNILLAGNSADDPGHEGANLTDSIMILSVDTKDNSAFMLSVPRDLYVQLPDAADADSTGHGKINQAILDSNFSHNGFPSGGMGLLEQTVQQDFGINIDYYALVNYTAFRDAVNAVGGISIDIQSTDPRGLYDPNRDYVTKGPLVKLTNGWHTLNGEQALDLARARGDPSQYGYAYGFPNSDFDRTAHQRQMMIALKTKAVSAGVLANPAKLSNLFDAVGNNVKTDLTLSQVHRLYDLTKDLNTNAIQSISLNSANGKNLLANYTSPLGESALVPAAGLDDFDDIQAFVNQITSNNPVSREGAQVVVLNASTKAGIASTARSKLTGDGITVAAIGDAVTTQATTTIVDNSGGKMPATKTQLQKLYGSHFVTSSANAGNYKADFIILLGADQAPATQTSQSSTSN